MALAPIAETQIIYPISDSKPLGETDFHVDLTLDIKAAHRIAFEKKAQDEMEKSRMEADRTNVAEKELARLPDELESMRLNLSK